MKNVNELENQVDPLRAQRRRTAKIRHVPVTRHRRITEQFLKETLHRLVRRVSRDFTMHALNDACCHAFPILNVWPEPLGMKYQPGSIVWLNRFADRESRQEVPCSGIHLQRVPVPVDDNYGIRLLLLQQKVHGST